MGDGDRGAGQALNSSDQNKVSGQDQRLLGQDAGGLATRPHETVPVRGPGVQIGDDRVIPESPNWAGMSHQQLYDAVHQDNNPSDAHGLAREWTVLGQEMAESSRALGEQVRGTESGWRGEAAEAARHAISQLVSWAETAAETSSYMAGRIADQAQIAAQAKATMPEPVHFNPAEELANAVHTGGIFGLIAAGVDLKRESDQARSAHDNAVHVMQTMESDSRHVDGNTPRFTPPPEVIKTSPTDTGPQPPTSAGAGLHPSTSAAGGGGSLAQKQSVVEPQAAGTVSAGASPAGVAQVSQPSAAASGRDASYDGAAAVSGGVPVGLPPSATLAAAASGAVRGGAPGGDTGIISGDSAGDGSQGHSAGTVKFRAVGSSAGGFGDSAAAPVSSAGYTPPPAGTNSQWDTPKSSGDSEQRTADGQGPARSPGQGWQHGMSGAQTRSSGSPSGRPRSVPRNPGVSSAMGDPKYWANKLGPGTEDGSSPQPGAADLAGTPGPADLAGTPGAAAPNPGVSSAMGDPKYWANKLGPGAGGGFSPQPGVTGLAGASGAGSTGGAGAAHVLGGGFSYMSGQLPPDGAASTGPEANQAAMGAGAPAASSAGAHDEQGGAAMGPMGSGAGRQGPQEKERRSPGYIKGEKIVEEPARVPPPVIGETFKKKRPGRD